MFLTAQHVRSPTSGADGINAFHYAHGPHVWQGMPPEGVLQNPGTLVAQTIVVLPPGNRVRSYLDLVAPDEASWTEIRQAFVTFIGEAQGSVLPWVGLSGRVFIRVGMEQALANHWHGEIAELYRAAQAARIGG